MRSWGQWGKEMDKSPRRIHLEKMRNNSIWRLLLLLLLSCLFSSWKEVLGVKPQSSSFLLDLEPLVQGFHVHCELLQKNFDFVVIPGSSLKVLLCVSPMTLDISIAFAYLFLEVKYKKILLLRKMREKEKEISTSVFFLVLKCAVEWEAGAGLFYSSKLLFLQ